MRTLRALLFGALSFFPGALIGLFVWWLLGASKENMDVAVWLPCNLIPIVVISLGFWYGWKTGAEYAINADVND